MYLLILFAFLHAEDPSEHIVKAHYRTLDECLIDASKRNQPDREQQQQCERCQLIRQPFGPARLRAGKSLFVGHGELVRRSL